MFRKILIANRGEIAVRVIRACREMNISPVAVYSEADAAALHVRLADEAYLIGAAPSSESYLRIERIVEVAKECGAEAVHPGYGFLAENAVFARACAAAGITFIGPPPAAMEMMGSKTNARRAAIEAGAPVVPGTTEPLQSADEARATASRFGYPVMLKAAAGGGGKGMRLVAAEDEIQSAFETAQSEAQSAFGDSSVYLEKAVERPRHVEIQIFADSHGNFAHLGERECSIQRRHQKVIEECPSPMGDPTLRAAMGEAAIRVARAADYVGAGTVEFLVSDVTRDFYFLEMNTRLQVEHPVTELVTGIDLVREQIAVAAGGRLSFTQDDVEWRGHAVECRVYAEDPENNFLPSPGRITFLRLPQGPGVRDDGGVYAGAEVSIYYDPMISKLAAWGRTRAEAVDRMRRALDEYAVGGIKTTLPFFREVVRDAEFIEGKLDTGFIPRFFARRDDAHAARRDGAGEGAVEIASRDMAAVAAALAREAGAGASSSNHQPPPQPQSRWKLAGRAAQHGSRDAF
ncbi:MAG TPA: acetyl-CoA carboxylase biotin carboxylase subunit [Pyrinomonadaceae bacterium]|jgi:acetyl-CoA carboxylase biotin carboxylase subunit|nr:acetyl-CoA carboxylase biotin carboxylase subunit [Pyrinomonadaceae bacterium]